MTKTGWVVATFVLFAIAGISFATYVGMKGPAHTAEQVPEVLPSAPAETGSELAPAVPSSTNEAVVTYSDSGFSPKNVEIAVGSTVRFVNNSTHTMWVGVDDHPSHTQYDGTSTKEHCAEGKNINGSFDQCVASPAGTTYTYTFAKAGSFEYHNHTRSADSGVVIVK